MRALANGLGAELQFEHGSLGVRARISNQNTWRHSLGPACDRTTPRKKPGKIESGNLNGKLAPRPAALDQAAEPKDVVELISGASKHQDTAVGMHLPRPFLTLRSSFATVDPYINIPYITLFPAMVICSWWRTMAEYSQRCREGDRVYLWLASAAFLCACMAGRPLSGFIP